VSSSPTDTSVLSDVAMPQMGVSVTEGTIVAWRVEVGDRIEAEQTICEISTDKIDTELPAPVSGVVAEILVAVDQTVEVGVVLARIAGGSGSTADSSGAAPAPARASALEGPETASGPAEAPPETASAPAGAAPGPKAVGASEAAPAAVSPAAGAPTSGDARRRYSPVVQRIAAEHDIDLDSVAGTGRGGRVRKQDVLAVVAGNGDGTGAGAGADPPLHIESPYRPDPTPAVAGSGQLPRMRRQIGEHMKRSLETAAHCTTWIEVDMSRVEAERGKLRVTALAFLARATVEALREHPALNAWLEGEKYTRPSEINLGIAVSLGEDGLIVPVIHNAHELAVEGLAARIKDLARRARARELKPDEVSGGTFTITAPGQFGSIMATPIINQPQVGILDFEAVVKRAVVVTDADGNDSIAIRPMTILGLSWDHRALDGVLSAQFLATVKRHLEGGPVAS
jgi:pyruvate/2-oxoglutarate dehydrogenase complex dihydrolipoamide acyltransferase (E2) component